MESNAALDTDAIAACFTSRNARVKSNGA